MDGQTDRRMNWWWQTASRFNSSSWAFGSDELKSLYYNLKTKGPWATICSPEQISHCISADVMQRSSSIATVTRTEIWLYCKKGQRSSKDHHLNKLGRPCIPDAIYQDSAIKLSWFWRFLRYGMEVILFNSAELFQQIENTSSTESLSVIFLQIWKCESQDSLVSTFMSPDQNLWVPLGDSQKSCYMVTENSCTGFKYVTSTQIQW